MRDKCTRTALFLSGNVYGLFTGRNPARVIQPTGLDHAQPANCGDTREMTAGSRSTGEY
jgi:hypothetical protein